MLLGRNASKVIKRQISHYIRLVPLFFYYIIGTRAQITNKTELNPQKKNEKKYSN